VADSAVQPGPGSAASSPDEPSRDLGFGAVVGRESQQRLLNRDGSFNVERVGLGFLESFAPYHFLLTTSWSGFFAVIGASYLVLNLAFAVGYLACGPDALSGPAAHMLGGRFSQEFFFSVQTFATIGYGQIGPNGFPANAIVTIEALVGLLYQALATGLLFARFTRPTAAFLFSNRAVVAPYRDGSALMFRIVNRRRNEIIELGAQVMFSALEPDGRGGTVRRYALLPLERSKVTFFPLSWTIVHPIDATSPLATRTAEDLIGSEAEILVLLTGIDQAVEQTVHTRSSYRADEIVWNARFQTMFRKTDGALLAVDIARLHDIEPVP